MSDTNRLGIRITATDTAGPALKRLNDELRQIQQHLLDVGGSAADAGGRITAALTKQLDVTKAQIAALGGQAQAIKTVTAALVEQGYAAAVVHRTLQEGINVSFGSGYDRQIKSAADSARTLATSLSAAAEADARFRASEIETAAAAAQATEALQTQGNAVRTLTGEQFFGVVNRKAGVGQPTLSAKDSAATFERALGSPGLGISSVETAGTINALHGINREILSAKDSAGAFASALGTPGKGITSVETAATINSIHGVGRELLSAKDSAAAFTNALGAPGLGISSVKTASTINTLHGINREIISAKDSASVFARELGGVGEKLTLTPSAGFSRMVSDLAGVGQPTLSAKESAGAFESALGPPGTGISVAETAATINRLQGIDREILSAKDSAAVFSRELGGLGEKLTLTPSAGFSRMVSDLAGVKQNYLSAADSAAVFQVAQAESAGVSGAMGTGFVQRESRHVIGLFDSLARGQRGQAISSIGAAARDAGLGVGALASSMGVLIGVMAGVAVLHEAAAMGKWATETKAAAAATGMSISEYSGLSAALTSMGMSGSAADMSMKRLGVSLSTAISQPASKSAEAFHNLGISQEQLVQTGGNVYKMVHMLADAYVRTADGANKTANMTELLGRGFQQLVPVLQQGGDGLDRLIAKEKDLGVVINRESAAALITEGQAVDTLATSIRGEGIAALVAWEPVILGAVAALKLLGEALGAVTTAVGRLPHTLFTLPNLTQQARQYAVEYGALPAAKTPGVSASTAGKVAVPPLTPPVSPLEAMRLQMAQAEQTASGTTKDPHQARLAEGRAQIAVMEQTLKTAQLTTQQRTQLATELAMRQTELANEQMNRVHMGGASASAIAHQSYADFAGAEKEKIASADGSMAQISAIYDQWLTEAEGRYHQHASVIEGIEKAKTQAINKDRLHQIIQGASDEEQANHARMILGRAALMTAPSAQPGAQPSPTGRAQIVAQMEAEAQQVQASAQREVQNLTEVMNAATEGSTTQRQAAHEIISVVTQAKQQEIALYEKAAEATKRATEKMLAPLTHMFDQMGSTFQSGLNSIVKDVLAPQMVNIHQGLTTLHINERNTQVHAALQKFALDMVMDATNAIEGGISKLAASGLASMMNIPLAAGGGMGKLFSSGMSSLFGIGGGGGGSGLDAAKFGLAANQLTMSATALKMAAMALQTAATTSGAAGAAGAAGGAGGSALGAAGSVVTPIVSAISAGSAADTAAQTMVGAASAATTTQSTTLLGGIIQAGNAFLGMLLSALNIKPSLLGFSWGGGGVVPSAAGGMVAGGTGGVLSILHAKEMVLPSHLSQGIQGIINNGGQGGSRSTQANLNYSPTINTSNRGRGGTGMTRAEFGQMMATHGGAMLGEARNMVRGGARFG